MNILFLSINTPPEGKTSAITSIFIKKEMIHLHARGHKVYYLSSLDEDIIEEGVHYVSMYCLLDANTFLRKFKNLVFALNNICFFKSLILRYLRRVLSNCGVERACIKAIRKYNIDIIHTNFFEPAGESAILASRICNVPVCATLRGAELRSMPEFDYGACLNMFYVTTLRKSINYIDYFTAPNKYLCKKLQTDFNAPKEKIEYVPNGVEKISIKKGINSIDKELKFISVCNMIKLKNLDIIFDSFEELSREFDFFKIVIVGNGFLRRKYENLLKILSPKKIYIYDEMAKNDLFKLISTCDCLIHPSFSEGMPNVVLESLNIGIPCLVSDIPAHQEIIKERFNGFLFDPYNRENFVTKMKYILSNKHSLSSMRDNCIDSVKKYSIELKIDRYLDIYKKLKSV